jgi:hypothetical protein
MNNNNLEIDLTIERIKVAEMEAVLQYIIDKELFKNHDKEGHLHRRIQFILMPPPKLTSLYNK